MRKTCLNTVYNLAKDDERIFFIGSDLGVGTLDEFRQTIPDRFFMEGISEANIVGMAAGLALEGCVVYVNTIAVFLTRRVFEQVALDACLHNLNVRLIGNGGGLVYAPLGPTHLATEDMAILRTLPNMTILAPADAVEMHKLMLLTADHDGPIYIRLAKGGDKIVTPEEGERQIGKGVIIREGNDALLVTTGITLQIALDAAESLKASGIESTILHLHTVKPIDKEAIYQLCKSVDTIVTIEEGTLIGGIGSAVAEIMAESNFNGTKRFKRIGIGDKFCDQYGSQADLLNAFGITAENIEKTILFLKNNTR